KNNFRGKEVYPEERVLAEEPDRRARDSQENHMLDKPTVLLVVIAIFIAAVWITAPPKAARQLQSDWLKKRLDAHRRFVNARVSDDLARTRSGHTQTNQDAIRRLYQDCGSY